MRNFEEQDRSCSILVVDDNPAMCAAVVSLLEEENISAKTVQSVDDAIQSLQKGRFGAILSDIRMPRKDGFKLLEEVLDVAPESRVIMMSSIGNEETADRVKREGAFDFLKKPFRRDELLSILKRALGEESSGDYE